MDIICNAAAELLVNCEVDVVLLYLVAQLVHIEKTHVPSVKAAQISDAVGVKIVEHIFQQKESNKEKN